MHECSRAEVCAPFKECFFSLSLLLLSLLVLLLFRLLSTFVFLSLLIRGFPSCRIRTQLHRAFIGFARTTTSARSISHHLRPPRRCDSRAVNCSKCVAVAYSAVYSAVSWGTEFKGLVCANSQVDAALYQLSRGEVSARVMRSRAFARRFVHSGRHSEVDSWGRWTSN